MIGDLALAVNRSTLDLDHERSLVQVDRLAAQAIEWIKPIGFSLARSDHDRAAAYRLRYQAVIDHGWLPPSDFPDGLERDHFDDQAVHILARDQGQFIATARLVLPNEHSRLPTEEAFDLIVEPQGQVVDAGRFVVAKSHSSVEHRLLAATMARSWLEVRSRGYSIVCAALASRAMLRVYQRMGFRMRTLALPRRVWGEDRSPIVFDVPSSADALIDRWSIE